MQRTSKVAATVDGVVTVGTTSVIRDNSTSNPSHPGTSASLSELRGVSSGFGADESPPYWLLMRSYRLRQEQIRWRYKRLGIAAPPGAARRTIPPIPSFL